MAFHQHHVFYFFRFLGLWIALSQKDETIIKKRRREKKDLPCQQIINLKFETLLVATFE